MRLLSHQVAIELDQLPSPGIEKGQMTDAAGAAKRFAEIKTRVRMLQSFGWAVATVSELEWAAAKENDHAKVCIPLAGP
jgi:hypothetical protein